MIRRVTLVCLGSAPGLLLATDEVLSPATVLAAIGALVTGVIAAIALLRRQDTDAALKSMQGIISGLQADHANCERKHAELESRLSALTGWLKRNRSAMEISGAKLEPLPYLE